MEFAVDNVASVSSNPNTHHKRAVAVTTKIGERLHGKRFAHRSELHFTEVGMSKSRVFCVLGSVAAAILGCQGVDSSRCVPEPLAPQRPTSLSAMPNASSPASAINERAAFIRSHYSKFEARIPMRDGVKLFTALYVPIDASRSRTYPFLITRNAVCGNPVWRR